MKEPKNSIMPNTINEKSTLSFKVFLYVFLISVLFTVMMTIIQFALYYNGELKRVKKEVNFISEVYSQSIAQSVYVLDDAMLETQIRGLISSPGISGIEVIEHEEFGERVVLKGEKLEYGEVEPKKLIHKPSEFEPELNIGEMRVYLDLSGFKSIVKNQFLIILLTNFIRIFLIAIVILYIVQFVITRHLMKMANYATEVDVNDEKKLKLDRREHEKPDELDLVVDSINQMKGRLQDNIDELKESNETLKNTQKKLVQSEKMSALGVLVAGVAHEVNNPTGYVKNSMSNMVLEVHKVRDILSDVIDKSSDDGSKFWKVLDDKFVQVDQHLDIMNEGVERIESIVRGLTELSRKESPVKEKTDIVEAIETTLTLVKTQYKDILFKLDAPPSLEFELFKNPLKQVLLNLIINSCQAIKNLEKENGEIKVVVRRSDKKALIKIIDNGGGIKEEIIDKVFDPFFTTKDPGKGTGLGLSICYNIIEDHGGTIMLNNVVGKGLEIEIELPIK